MGSVSELTSCMLVLVGAAAAQTAQSTHYERLLPQWLTGIIAVCGFLILTFIAALVKKMWFQKSGGRPSAEPARDNEYVENNPYETNLDNLRPKRTSQDSEKGNYETSLDILRGRDGSNVYDHVIEADKSTAM